MKRALALVSFWLTVLMAVSGTANRSSHAEPASLDFIVNSTADVPDVNPGNGVCETANGNGVCTLRGAIQTANAHPGADTIVLASATYRLLRAGEDDTALNGDLDITDTVTLLGAGPTGTLIDGNGGVTSDRVFQLINGTVIISGVAILNGQSSRGGGIYNDLGALTLINSTVMSNTALGLTTAWGGGIYNRSGAALTLTHSTISGNSTGSSTSAYGGGIMNQGRLWLSNSLVSGNTTPGGGGGISTGYGSATLLNSTVSGNSARNGGGIYKGNESLIVINSTISGNTSSVDGGGIDNSSGPTSLFNVTMAYNRANADNSGVGVGGGVVNGVSGTLSFINTIMALNTNVVVPGPLLFADDCAGIITSQGFNLVNAYNPAYCTVNGPFNLIHPLLGPLADNGGSTPTHALLAGSPAIDAGELTNCTDPLGAPITTDQRGHPRPSPGGRCDIGAFEFAYSLYLPLIEK